MNYIHTFFYTIYSSKNNIPLTLCKSHSRVWVIKDIVDSYYIYNLNLLISVISCINVKYYSFILQIFLHLSSTFLLPSILLLADALPPLSTGHARQFHCWLWQSAHDHHRHTLPSSRGIPSHDPFPLGRLHRLLCARLDSAARPHLPCPHLPRRICTDLFSCYSGSRQHQRRGDHRRWRSPRPRPASTGPIKTGSRRRPRIWSLAPPRSRLDEGRKGWVHS